jgi:NSS family neurotransmitter:Na+ symporter
MTVFENMTVYDATDYIASNVLLPLGGMLTAIFAGWFMTRDAARDELGIRRLAVFRIWRFLIRYVAPAAIGLMLITVLR